jgi:hypothetical protein
MKEHFYIKYVVFLIVTPCSWKTGRRFGVIYCRYLQDRKAKDFTNRSRRQDEPVLQLFDATMLISTSYMVRNINIEADVTVFVSFTTNFDILATSNGTKIHALVLFIGASPPAVILEYCTC